MTDQTLLAKARKARFDDLPNFSGHLSEDVERFLKSIKNITKANDESDNPEILEIVRGKLTQSAGIWFDNNESIFQRWSDFETAFRNRYFPTTLAHQHFDKLKQRKQPPDETVTSYFDDVVKSYHPGAVLKDTGQILLMPFYALCLFMQKNEAIAYQKTDDNSSLVAQILKPIADSDSS
ncbi:unnamed protein product [Rotaria sp. Silwood2]|nr:unnamed protein product [Rotaria sp. Silwood2]CAF3359305.1 unnamed protein product [Rotaria sp. Silwood2]CAF4284576.1 unnamed protein product [Rotaria sp. Silwood2]CAF4325383.1 unnamed protein product [Rotaria sp. Silwood2]CAF4423863.1 unnamed protein product [Rotaria sp. Silwood2]